ncbi:hypothetical protein CVT24_002272, partial [Panaeolus cyanescens]
RDESEDEDGIEIKGQSQDVGKSTGPDAREIEGGKAQKETEYDAKLSRPANDVGMMTPPRSGRGVVKEQIISPVVPKASPTRKPHSRRHNPVSPAKHSIVEAINIAGKANYHGKHKFRKAFGDSTSNRNSNETDTSTSGKGKGRAQDGTKEQKSERVKERQRKRALLSKVLLNVGNTPDEPIDLTSDVEVVPDAEGLGEGQEADETGPSPTIASSLGGASPTADVQHDGGRISGNGEPSKRENIGSAGASASTSAIDPHVLSTSRNLVSLLKQKAASKKQMRYSPSTPSSGGFTCFFSGLFAESLGVGHSRTEGHMDRGIVSPRRAQFARSPQYQIATPPHRSSLPGSLQKHQVSSCPQSQIGSPSNTASPVRFGHPYASSYARRSSFASPTNLKHELGHMRIASAPNSSQMFSTMPQATASTSKPTSLSKAWIGSPKSPARGEEQSSLYNDSEKHPLPTRIPVRSSAMVSMPIIPATGSQKTSTVISRKRARSVDATGSGGTGSVAVAATMKDDVPIAKIVERRKDIVEEQTLGGPAVVVHIVGMGDADEEDDDGMYTHKENVGEPQQPRVSDDDKAMAEIQDLVSASRSDEDIMDVDHDNLLPHPPISKAMSSIGKPLSFDSNVSSSRSNGVRHRSTPRSSPNELFDHASSLESNARTTHKEIVRGIAGGTTFTQQHQQRFGPVAKTYGGFPLIFWPEERRNMQTYSKLAEPKFARDLPHKLQDHINA